MSRVKSIGLIGMAGSGKSLATAYFKTKKIPIISADHIAKRLLQPGEAPYQHVLDHFGDDILNAEGILDRKRLRERILKNPAEKEWLEAYLHPIIRQTILSEIKQIKDSPYCVIEIPLLLERESYPYLTTILCIDAPFEQKVERIMARDHCTRIQALQLLKVQDFQAIQHALADEIIINDTTPVEFFKKLEAVHIRYFA